MFDERKKIKQLERIIESSIRVFSVRGYRQAQMSHIAKDMGISPGSLYLYFESKEALFEFVLKHIYIKQNFKGISFPIKTSSKDFGFSILKKAFASGKPFVHLKEVVRKKTVDNACEEFENIIRILFSTLSTYRNGITIMLHSSLNWPELNELYVNAVKDFLRMLSAYLTLRIDQGHIRKVPDASAAARLILECTAWFAVHRYRAMYQPNINEKIAEETVVGILMHAFIPDHLRNKE
jgi:AcrR family transcriptional regulator